MITGIVIGVCFVLTILYVHKVGLPAIVNEIKNLRSDITVATARHASITSLKDANGNINIGTVPPKPTVLNQ